MENTSLAPGFIYTFIYGNKHGGERMFFNSFEALRDEAVGFAEDEDSPGALLVSMAEDYEKLEKMLEDYSEFFFDYPTLAGKTEKTADTMYAYCWSEDTGTAVMDWAGVKAEALAELEDFLDGEALEELEQSGSLDDFNGELANYSHYDSFIQAITA